MTAQVDVDVKLVEARQSLLASEENFRLLVDSVRDYAIFLLTPTGFVASWNTGAKRIKGYEADEIVGRHFSEFYVDEDVRAGKCEHELEVATREGRFEDEGWRKRKDGSLFWANVIITALHDPSGRLVGFAKVTRDLTERRRAEDQRVRLAQEQKAREAADAANRAKDDFLAHVSHELRTPLNAILGWARLLATGTDEERRSRATKTIERNAEAMRQLIDDLLDVSRIISGKMRLEVEPVDLPLVIERAIESVRLGADAKEIHLALALEVGTAPVMGDASRLQQVIWNLLSNAVKFTPKGGRIAVTLRALDKSAAEVVVTDSGIGIREEAIPNVFDPFWQASSGPSRGGRGLGLGLAITKKLVELHGGRVEVESAGEGKGTAFTVTLPLVSNPRGTKPSSEPSEPDTSSRPRLDGIRVLLVEDEVDARELVRVVLEECGATVTMAGSADEALAALTTEVPDVLLSDIGLPGESGFDRMRRVRALPPDKGGRVPAAAMTAYARTEDRLKAIAAGFLVHVAKPVEPSEVAMVVAALAQKDDERR